MNDDDTKKLIFALLDNAEQQQKSVEKIIEELKILHTALPPAIAKANSNALSCAQDAIGEAIDKKASGVAEHLRSSLKGALQAQQSLSKTLDRFTWQTWGLWLGGFTVIVLALLIGIILWIPSLDEIAERRATVASLVTKGGTIDVKNCDGKPCVRVNKDQCGYGKHGDYCVADLK